MSENLSPEGVRQALTFRLEFIRHGRTAGNLEGRYIGRTDESLCPEGIRALTERKRPQRPDLLFASPMKRCLETAGILFPEQKPLLLSDLREYDFGSFEGKNHAELMSDPSYQAWLEAGGTMEIPAGEGLTVFKRRCRLAFEESLRLLLKRAENDPSGEKAGPELTASYVVHGGTIMALFSAFDEEKKDYYDYQIKNGEGLVRFWDGTHPVILRKEREE